MSVVASDRSDRASSGYLSIHRTPTGARSPTSSICSFAGSVNSETVIAHNKYLMKTLCLSKKSTSMPDKTEYANLLTAGLGKNFFWATYLCKHCMLHIRGCQLPYLALGHPWAT